MKEESELFEEGFVTLTNLEYRVFLSLGDYDDCLSDTRHQETVCGVRPCLVRWGRKHLHGLELDKYFVSILRNQINGSLKCYRVSDTDFLVSNSDVQV